MDPEDNSAFVEPEPLNCDFVQGPMLQNFLWP